MEKKQVTSENEMIVDKEEKKEKYFYAVGKRKTAVAQVRIYPTKKPAEMSINDKKSSDFFSIERFFEVVKAPLVLTGQNDKFNVTVKVSGGGINAQAEAIRLGISRALIGFDEGLRKTLRDCGFLTRDSRIVERKKAGLKKARRAPQWAKR